MLEVTGLVASAANNGSPLLQQALQLGRGGAVVLATSALSSLADSALRGGAAAPAAKKGATPVPTKKSPPTKKSTPAPPKKKSTAIQKKPKSDAVKSPAISPRAKAVFFMAVAMSMHYLGYSLARPITISLFTSEKSGYGGIAAAFPFAMAFVSPMSLALLLGYGKVLDKFGPRGALIGSTLFCAFVVSGSAVAINLFEKAGTLVGTIPAAKFVSGPLFVFRESYVQLLTSQYWSFMASALTPNQSAKWFGPIAGLTSITSAIAGFFVQDIIKQIGISYSLLGTGVTLLISILAVNMSYNVANENGFSPAGKKHGPTNNKAVVKEAEIGLFRKAMNLFTRVPVLWKLFVELMASQGLATILNVAFVARLGRSIPDDAERAGWMGKFFSTINVITMVLQFGILPPLVAVIEPKMLWRIVPLATMIFTCFQAFQQDPSLYIVSASMLVMKVMEYSARRLLDEMVFVPLDFESRFVGKEVIGVFGYRFGKSLMSLGLSGLTYLFGDFGIQEYSVLGALANLYWFRAAWSLSNEVPTRKEAEDMHQQRNIKGAKK
jgi:ATP/ADP translocase